MMNCSPAVLEPGRIHAPMRCWSGSPNCGTSSRPPSKLSAPPKRPVVAVGAVPAVVTGRAYDDVSARPPLGGAVGVGLGVAVGVAVGVGLGVAVGVGLGVGVGVGVGVAAAATPVLSRRFGEPVPA